MSLTAVAVTDNSDEYQDFLSLYHTAFPLDEQIPEEYLQESIHMYGVSLTAYYEEETQGKKLFAGFTFVVDTEQFLFLYYLAVNPELRSRGLGSEIIKNHLMKKYAGKIIVLNVESPDDSAEDNISRLRRIAFYKRLGFIPMNCSFYDGRVQFSVLSTSSELDLNRYLGFLQKMCSIAGDELQILQSPSLSSGL